MSDIAINDKGDALRFDGKSWVPAEIAVNDKGERMAFDGAQWRAMPAAEKGLLQKGAEAVNTGVNWLGTQFTKGATGLIGLPGVVDDAMNYGVARVFGNTPEQAQKYVAAQPRITPRPDDLNRAVFDKLGVPEVNAGDNPAFTLTNPLGIEGKVNLGKMADAAMQAVPGGKLLGAAVIPSMAGGATSEAAGQATEGSPWEIPARLAAGFLGYKAGQRLQTPLPANLTEEQARLVQMAKDKGIPLTVGQETGRGRGIESAVARFPTSQGRMANFADEQATAINRDALAQAGATGDRLDPTTMNRVIKQASADFEAAKNTSGNVRLDKDFFRALENEVGQYIENTPASARAPVVGNRARDFVGSAPELTGPQYQEFRRSLNTAMTKTGDSGVRNALKGMREALDDAMEASLPSEQAAAWHQVRRNWANLKILTRSAAGGTVDSRAAGNLSPSALSTTLRQRQGVDRFSSTEGGLNDTARVAAYLSDTIPNSGTPQTLMMQGAMTGGPIAAGFAAGGVPGALGAGAALTIPNLVARVMTGTGGARWLRDYLSNQSQAGQMGLLNARSAPFALAPGIATLPPPLRLESRQ